MEQKFDPMEIHDPLKVYGTISDKNGNVRPYKVYTAFLRRNGVAGSFDEIHVLENTIGEVTTSTASAPFFAILSNGLFTLNKTVAFFTQAIQNAYLSELTIADSSIIIFEDQGDAGVSQLSIEIRVYE